MKKTSSWKFERVEKEYHSGDASLIGRELIQVTIPVKDSMVIIFAVRQLVKYSVSWVILKEKGKENGFCALFREKNLRGDR